MFIAFIVVLFVLVAVAWVGQDVRTRLEKENIALRETNRTLEERNESLDRQNQLMERQYNLFSTKPVMTLLNEEQFTSLARVVASTVIALTKQTN